MTACILHGHHHLGQFPGRRLDTRSHLADVVVLAKDAAQIAHGKKDRAAAVPATKWVLLSHVGKTTADQGVAADLADGRLVFQSVHTAVAGAGLTIAQHLHRLLSPPGQFAATMQVQIRRFELVA